MAVMQLETLLVKLVGDASQFDNMLDQLESRMSKMTSRLSTMGGKMSQSLLLPLGVGAALIGREFSKLDDALTRSMINMGETGEAAKQAMKTAIFNISSISVTGPTDLAIALTTLGRTGMSTAEALTVLGQVERFAVGTGSDLQESVKAVTQAQIQLGLVSKDVATDEQNLADIMDVFARASQLGNTSALQMAEAFSGKAGNALREHHQSISQGAAAILAFSSAGIQGEAAGQLLNQTLKQLEQSAAKHADVWKKLGIPSLYDANKQMLPLSEIAGLLQEKLGGASDEARAMAFSQLGFNNRMIDGIKLLMQHSGELSEWRQQLDAAGGSVDRMAGQYLASFTAQLEITRNLIFQAGEAIADELAPYLLMMNNYLRDAIAWWEGLNPGLRTVIITTFAVAAGFALISAAIGGLSALIGFLIAPLAAVVEGLIDVIGAVAGFVIFNPEIVLAGLAIAGLVYWLVGPEGLVDAWDAALQGAKDFAWATVGFLYNIKENFSTIVDWIKNNWRNLWEDAKSIVSVLFYNMIRNGMVAQAIFIEVWRQAILWMADNWGNLMADMTELVVVMFLNTVSNAMVAFNLLMRFADIWSGYMAGLFRRVFTIEFALYLMKGIWEGLKMSLAFFVSFFKAILDMGVNVFTNMGKFFWSAIKGGVTGATDDIKKELERSMHEWTQGGANILSNKEGELKDFDKGMKNPFKAMQDAAGEELLRIRGPMDGFKSNADWSKLATAVSKAVTNGMGDMKLFEGFQAQTKALTGLNFSLPNADGFSGAVEFGGTEKERKEAEKGGGEDLEVKPPSKGTDFKMINRNQLSIEGLAGFKDPSDKGKGVNGPKVHGQLDEIIKALQGMGAKPALGK